MQPLSLKRGLFLLFGLAAAAGLALSWFISRLGHDVIAASTPLLQQKLPQLERVARLDSALIRQQVTLNQYFAESINRAQFSRQYAQNDREILDGLATLARTEPDQPTMAVLQETYRHTRTLGAELDRQLQRRPPDLDEARAVLVEVGIDTRDLRSGLDKIKHAAQDAVMQGGHLTQSRLQTIIDLVHAYSLAIVVIALLVGYYIHARLRAERKLAYQASHDRLTGLLNQRSFEERLHGLASAPHDVLLLTVDRFQRVIDGLGHRGGDQLLRAIGARLADVIDGADTALYRFEGAHFAVIRRADRAAPDRDHLAQTLHGAMAAPFDVHGQALFASLSIGGVRYPEDGGDPAGLLRNADAAMQLVRRRGGRDSQWYTREMNQRAVERLALETELSYAVERGELQLLYQPQIALDDRRVVGVEALLRWRRGDRMVSPAEFIPLAEESGLIVPIGAWILTEACRQAWAWREAGLPPLTIAVNVSARQFQHPDFVPMVAATLARTGIAPDTIALEITESVVMQDAEHTVASLVRLRELGLTLAIDDFGTGYSSLAYLRRFPIDKLKIDQSFIRNLRPESGDAAIVDAVIQLGRSLGLTVIAEGVETDAQLAQLARQGCDEIQGYLFSRPLPADELARFLTTHPQRELA